MAEITHVIEPYLTESNSWYASGQSLNVQSPHPKEASEYAPNETSNHQGIYFH